jgi:hypothetical protein
MMKEDITIVQVTKRPYSQLLSGKKPGQAVRVGLSIAASM